MSDQLHLGIACEITAALVLLLGGLLFHPFLALVYICPHANACPIFSKLSGPLVWTCYSSSC